MRHCQTCGDRPNLHNRLCILRGAEALEMEENKNE